MTNQAGITIMKSIISIIIGQDVAINYYSRPRPPSIDVVCGISKIKHIENVKTM